MCKCTPFTEQLIKQGFFPTAPSQPNLAVSISFLKFYRTLFEHTDDAVTAIVAALSNFHDRHGYLVVDKKVSLNNSKCLVYLHCSGGAYCGSLPQVLWCSSTVVWMSVWGDLSIYHCQRALNNKSNLVKAICHSCCSTSPKMVSCILWESNDWPVIQGVSPLANIYWLANADLHCKAEETHMLWLTVIFIRGI